MYEISLKSVFVNCMFYNMVFEENPQPLKGSKEPLAPNLDKPELRIERGYTLIRRIKKTD